MNDRITAVEAYQNAIVKGDDASVAGHMADDVMVETQFGRAEGVEGALALLREPRIGGLLAAGPQWTEPTESGDTITVTARFPATAPFGGVEFVFTFTGAKISRIEQLILPAAPLPPAELRLTDEIKDAVNGAFDNQTPMMIAYSDGEGEIHLSFRGTIQAFSDDQLALWARDPGGGLPRHITARPKVTVFYHDPKTRTTYAFYGRARIANDPDVRAAVFDNSPARERQMDFRRGGVAIVVDLDKVEGRSPAGRILMLRSLGRRGTPAGVSSGHEARRRVRAADTGSVACGCVYGQQPAVGSLPAGGCCVEYGSGGSGRLERVRRTAADRSAAGLGTIRVQPAQRGHAACPRRVGQHRGDPLGASRPTARAAAAGQEQQDPLGFQAVAQRADSASHPRDARRDHSDSDGNPAARPGTVVRESARARLLDTPPELVRPHRRTKPALRVLTGHDVHRRRPGPRQEAAALHARICIERGRWWQAEHWISAIRAAAWTNPELPKRGLPGA